jgi:hypothetical protein
MSSEGSDGGIGSALKETGQVMQKAVGVVGKGCPIPEAICQMKMDAPKEILDICGKKLNPDNPIYVPGKGLFRISPNGGILLPELMPDIVETIGVPKNDTTGEKIKERRENVDRIMKAPQKAQELFIPKAKELMSSVAVTPQVVSDVAKAMQNNTFSAIAAMAPIGVVVLMMTAKKLITGGI